MMAKKKEPENIRWIVTGRAVFVGATCLVHAKTHQEAIAKANKREHLDGINIERASLTNFSGSRAKVDVDQHD